MSAFTTSVILEGRPHPSPTPVRMHAGPLTMLLEPASGFLRQIKLGDELVLNGIYAAVRDHNWGTVVPAIRELKIDQQPESFAVEFIAECRQEPIHFVWHGRISGDTAGTIHYTFDGEARSDFLRNRIGFCVLHGANCAGRPCVVEHVDGRRTESVFPRFISPHQPFKQVRAITHSLTPVQRKEIEVRLSGEVFEMEDQRNWTDASFKIYCTPLDRPFPVPVRKGERFRQTIDLHLAAERKGTGHLVPQPVSAGSPSVVHSLEPSFHPLPHLGLGMATHALPLSDREAGLLKHLQLNHLRCDLTPLTDGWETRWHEAVRQARALNARLHVALHLNDRGEDQLAAVASRPETGLVEAWLIRHVSEKATAERWTRRARELLGGRRIVGGTDAYFAELNRTRPTAGGADAMAWSINPQVHAFDNLSLIEALDAQWETVASARELFATDLMISPVTLQPRFNPNATAAPPITPPDELPPEVDVRQMSLFGAAWTLGSIASLSRGPLLRSITYYETTGWRGLMEWSERPRLPHKFVTRPGWVFPMYFVFAALAGFDEGQRVRVASPMRHAAMLIRQSGAPGPARLLVASFDREVTGFAVPDGFTPRRRWTLDQENAVAMMRDPEAAWAGNWLPVTPTATLSLSPFSLTTLEGVLS